MPWSTQSRRARGYGPEWDRLRKLILQRDNYLCQCQHCRAAHRTTAANEVDHIVPKAHGGRDSMDNLQAINRDCHVRKTVEDQGGQRRERVTIGVDGWPRT